MSQSEDFSELTALFLNCTLKKSPEFSHTEGMIENSAKIMRQHGVIVSVVRPVDFDIAFGVYPDMTEHGWNKDDWPVLSKKVMEADILVLGTPIWLGEKSSVSKLVIERLYAHSSEQNAQGQYKFYGKTGGCLVTGNEDGIKHCAMGMLYSLQHIGYTIPPQADAGWIGEAGPGPSYLDQGSGGPNNEFTNKNVTFMAWNLMHMAKMLKTSGGLPAFGNSAEAWEKGERFDFEKPKYKNDSD